MYYNLSPEIIFNFYLNPQMNARNPYKHIIICIEINTLR